MLGAKYKGELEVQRIFEKHFILSVSWVFGVNGNNFVKTMIRLVGMNLQLKYLNKKIMMYLLNQ